MSQKKDDKDLVKEMAVLLKSGAAMLNYLCPNCNVPLFKLKTGEVICPKCKRRFVIVSGEEEEFKVKGNLVIKEVERAAIEQLHRFSRQLSSATAPHDAIEVSNVLLRLLEIVRLARKIRAENFEAAKGKG